MHETKRTPLVVIEEHHEAFFLWHAAIARQWIPSTGNCLLHVDEHSDLVLPLLRTPLAKVETLSQAAKFTYNELGIGSFIWPAICQRIFDDLIWLSRARNIKRGRQVGIVWHKDGDPLTLACRITKDSTYWDLGRDGSDCLWAIGVEFSDITTDLDPRNLPVVLDIDLDYFISNKAPQGHFDCEITEAEYHRFLSDAYHGFRLFYGQSLKAVETRGKFFLVADTFSPGKHVNQVSRDDLALRINEFGQFLIKQKINPAFISICKSFHSGYTPSHLAAFLEQELVQKLSTIYPIEAIDFAELLAAASEPEAVRQEMIIG
jgi:UPF0489 domain